MIKIKKKKDEEFENDAIEMLYKAAKLGDTFAQFYLGFLCCYGVFGFEDEDDEAEKWLEMAARKGNTDAQYHLGLCYLAAGNEEGLKWLCKEAENGYQIARERLDCYYDDRNHQKTTKHLANKKRK